MADIAVQEANETELTKAPACAHHWVIAMPDGATSLGKCKRCGMEKDFPNSAEDGLWEREVPQSRWTGRTEMKSFKDGY